MHSPRPAEKVRKSRNEYYPNYIDDNGNEILMDRYRHCWVSCKLMAGGLGAACSYVGGLMHEAQNEFREWFNRHFGNRSYDNNAIEDMISNGNGIACGNLLRNLLEWRWETCECCCSRMKNLGWPGSP